MALSEFLDFMPDTVTIEGYASQSVSGVPTYDGDPVEYPAYIEMKNRRVISHDGREIVSRGRIYLGTTVAPSVRDKITLPSTYSPVSPPIIAVNPASDENGTHHIVLDIG